MAGATIAGGGPDQRPQPGPRPDQFWRGSRNCASSWRPGCRVWPIISFPSVPTASWVVVHHGHGCTLDDAPGPADAGFGLQRTLHALLREGYGALGVFMPRMRPGDCTGQHEALCQMTNLVGSPLRFFLEPTAISLNYLKQGGQTGAFAAYRAFHMVGLSGGGWTTTVYAALDPTIRCSVSVAGTIPLYLRSGGSIGDREQFEPSFYRLAGYPDLYVLGAARARAGAKCNCCCGGMIVASAWRSTMRRPPVGPTPKAMREFAGRVKAALNEVGAGSFGLEFDDTAPEPHDLAPRDRASDPAGTARGALKDGRGKSEGRNPRPRMSSFVTLSQGSCRASLALMTESLRNSDGQGRLRVRWLQRVGENSRGDLQ